MLAELVTNLVHEQHADAWLDLAGLANGQRQRLAGQLSQALESSAVLLAGAFASQQAKASPAEADQFVKATDSVHVSIRSLLAQPNRSLELLLPSESSLLGSKWMNSDERLTLHLQASANLGELSGTTSGAGSGPQSTELQAATDGQSGKCFRLGLLASLMGATILETASETSRRDGTTIGH